MKVDEWLDALDGEQLIVGRTIDELVKRLPFDQDNLMALLGMAGVTLAEDNALPMDDNENAAALGSAFGCGLLIGLRAAERDLVGVDKN